LKKVKEDMEESVDKRRAVKKTYYKAVSLTKGVMSAIKSGEKVNLKKAKRVVESIVDSILNEEFSLIGMTTIKDYDEYTYNHSVNVSILSIALGQRMVSAVSGISREIVPPGRFIIEDFRVGSNVQ
jgi:HD-GYP domain-containing protein (c-di-GMP phosphodiesterase class II)